MGNSPSFGYYVFIIFTILNIMTLFIWLSIINVIRLTSGVIISVNGTPTVGYTGLSGSGSVNNGNISFTIVDPVPSNGTLPIRVTFPYVPPTSFQVAVIGVSAGNFNASQLQFNVIDKGSNYFVFDNGFPFQVDTHYVVSYVVTFS